MEIDRMTILEIRVLVDRLDENITKEEYEIILQELYSQFDDIEEQFKKLGD